MWQQVHIELKFYEESSVFPAMVLKLIMLYMNCEEFFSFFIDIFP